MSKERKARLELVITIDDEETRYNLAMLDPDERVASPAFRLVKDGTGEVYDIHVDQFGPHCTCASATYRQNEWCKHILALCAVKLLAPDGNFPP